MVLIEKAIKEHKSLMRSNVDDLLWNKLPEWMNEKQKKVKINNLLSEMRNGNRIVNKGTDAKSIWMLVVPNNYKIN